MRIVTWTLRLLLFLFALAFAVRNVEPVTLRFYFDLSWTAPLIAVLFIVFVVGAAIGLLAALPTLLAHRREILQMRRDLDAEQVSRGAQEAARVRPPPAEGL